MENETKLGEYKETHCIEDEIRRCQTNHKDGLTLKIKLENVLLFRDKCQPKQPKLAQMQNPGGSGTKFPAPVQEVMRSNPGWELLCLGYFLSNQLQYRY